MTKTLRKYQKQLLAVFGVLLMIIFIMPQSMKNGRSFTRKPIGTIGKEAVYNDEKAQATSDWSMLRRVDTMVPFLPSRYNVGTPWVAQPAPYVYQLGRGIVDEIDRNPDLYLLLQHEAQQRGIEVSVDQVGTVMQNDLFMEGDQQFTPVSADTIGAENFDALRLAVARFLPVLTLVNRVESEIKITAPLTQREIAGEQLVRLAIVDLPADHFSKQVAAPTPQQLQAQYARFSNVIAGTDHPADDPLGFGYKLPDRVRVQYVMIPHDQLVKTVRASRSPYDWEVDERIYYYAHQDDYVGLPPAPTTAPTTMPSTTQAAVAAQPTTRPFAEVQDKVAEMVMAAPMADLAAKIQSAISARMLADLKSSQNAGGATSAATLDSKAYLDAIALEIQKQFGVFPEITQVGDWLDSKSLADLPGIGSAMADDKTFTSIAIPAGGTGEPALLEPSAPLKDSSGNSYIFRITARDPSHTPPLTDIASKVETDYRLAAAYGLAKDAAKSLLESARKIGLSSAAMAGNFPVIPTTPFKPDAGAAITEFPLSSDSQSLALTKAGELLMQATADNPHPLAVVEFPVDKKVAVFELAGVSSHVPSNEMYLLRLTRAQMETHVMGEGVADRYFSYDAVKTRLNYVPSETSTDKAGM